MIKTLEDRLAERKAEYDKLILAEHKAQRIIDALPVIFTNPEADYFNVYENGVYFDLYPKDVETAELRILPLIADMTKEKWIKRVDKEEVTYSLSHYATGWSSVFRVHPRVEGTCRIIARATGKVRRTSKYVTVEEPEVEYLVDCDEAWYEDTKDA